MKKSIILTTRNRPQGLVELITSAMDYAEDKDNLSFYCYVDDDDSKLSQYKKIAKQFSNLTLKVGPAFYITKSQNILCNLAVKDGTEVIIGANDNLIYESLWDTPLNDFIQQIPDQIYCCWFNDGDKSHVAPAFPIVSKRWYEILGYFYPEVFMHFVVDRWVFYIARKINRAFYLSHVKTTHFTLTQEDILYEETSRMGRWKLDFDTATFHHYKHLVDVHAKKLADHCQPLPQSFYEKFK